MVADEAPAVPVMTLVWLPNAIGMDQYPTASTATQTQSCNAASHTKPTVCVLPATVEANRVATPDETKEAPQVIVCAAAPLMRIINF